MNDSTKLPRSIAWPGIVAIALLLLLPLSVLMVRAGNWQQGLLLYALACLGSVVVLIIYIVQHMRPRLAPHRGAIRKRSLLTLPGTLALLALTAGGGDYPRIHDITTDTDDPPLFVRAEQERGTGANSIAVKPDVIAQQRAAYPDLKSIESPLQAQAAFDRAVTTAGELGWRVYYQDRNTGIIEAVDTTRIMAFKDDVVIRVRASGSGSELDLRSVSRVGQGDIGANAKRIRTFAAAFNGG